MTNSELIKAVTESSVNSSRVKVYFKSTERQVLIGIFVNLRDSEDLLRKNLVRFVNESKREAYFAAPSLNTGLTSLLALSAIEQIRKA